MSNTLDNKYGRCTHCGGNLTNGHKCPAPDNAMGDAVYCTNGERCRHEGCTAGSRLCDKPNPEPLYTRRQVVDEIMACEDVEITMVSVDRLGTFYDVLTTDEVLAKLEGR